MDSIKKQIENILVEDLHSGKVNVYITDIGLSDQLVKDLFANGKGVVRVSDVSNQVIESVPELKEKISLAISTFDGVSTDMLSHPVKTEFKEVKTKKPITEPIKSKSIDEAMKTFFMALGEINEITSQSSPYLETSLIENFIDRYYIARYNQRITDLNEAAEKEGTLAPDDEWIGEEYDLFMELRAERLKELKNAKDQQEQTPTNN